MGKTEKVCHCDAECKKCGGVILPSPSNTSGNPTKTEYPNIYESGKRLYINYNGVEHDVSHILKPYAAVRLESLMPDCNQPQPLVIHTNWWPKSKFSDSGFEIRFTNGIRIKGRLEDISER